MNSTKWWRQLVPGARSGHSERAVTESINQSINQSKHISIAPYVASESEATWYVALRQSQTWRIWGLLWRSLRQTAWWGRPGNVVQRASELQATNLLHHQHFTSLWEMDTLHGSESPCCGRPLTMFAEYYVHYSVVYSVQGIRKGISRTASISFPPLSAACAAENPEHFICKVCFHKIRVEPPPILSRTAY